MANLPTELVESILEYVKQDYPTLISSARISRNWYAPSRAYLFHTISLRTASLFHHFFSLLFVFPHLAEFIRHLRIYQDVNEPTSPEDITTPIAGSKVFKRLALRLLGCVHHSLHVSLFPSSLTGLKSLDVTNVDCRRVSKLLHASSSLEHLKFKTSELKPLSLTGRPFDLSHNSSLRSLTLDLVSGTIKPFAHPDGWLPKLLSTLPTPSSVETLTISISLLIEPNRLLWDATVRKWDYRGWKHIDSILASAAQFPILKEVDMTMKCWGVQTPLFAELVKREMKNLGSKLVVQDRLLGHEPVRISFEPQRARTYRMPEFLADDRARLSIFAPLP